MMTVERVTGNPLSGGPKLTEQHYHYKGSHYVTAGLLGLGTLTLICHNISYR